MGRDAAFNRDMVRRGQRVKRRAQQIVRARAYDTGRLHRSIGVRVGAERGEIVVTVGSPLEYARWVHDGTGIYGPRGRPIRPVRAKVLVFTPKGSNQVVAAKQVRGTPPVPFLRDALAAARD